MINPKPNYCYVDVETTGLHPDLHEVWEVGLIYPRDLFPGSGDRWEWAEREWQLPVDLGTADPFALEVGKFYYRRKADQFLTKLESFAVEFSKLTRGLHLVGAVISFDAERLADILRDNGQCPGWHYHIIDIEAMVAGYLMGKGIVVDLPYKSDQLSREIGILPEKFEAGKHTALGDCEWVKAQHEALLKGVHS